jgi:uracil-DNA glycosylase family 4
MSDKQNQIQKITSEINQCEKCELSLSRLNTVPGEGSVDAKVVLVGEAPGKREDELGRPFVGRAGALLDSILDGVGLERSEIYILNILKCRPPKNRRPKKVEIVNCENYLMGQLVVLKPRIIAPMGNSSLSYFQRKYGLEKAVIGDIHGRSFDIKTEWGPILLFPLYHPAAAIYNRQLIEVLREDMEHLSNIMNRI